MSAQRQIKLGAFVQATGHHIAAWLHPGAEPDAGLNFQHYLQLARAAEAAKFDLLFVADSPGGYANYEETEVFARNAKAAHFEPVTLWSALSALTTHIGFVATSSTTYEDPYTTARKFASLDWISGGRAAWNVVTPAPTSRPTSASRRNRRTPTAMRAPRSTSTSSRACGTPTRTTPSSGIARAACSSIRTRCTWSTTGARTSRSAGR